MTITDNQEVERREVWLSDARALLDYLEAHPDLVPPDWSGIVIVKPALDSESLAAAVKLVGSGEKFATDYTTGIRRHFGAHKLLATASKDSTCEQVETGETKQVVKTAAPASEIPEGARNVRTVTTTLVVYEIDEPVTEWRCPPSMLGAESI